MTQEEKQNADCVLDIGIQEYGNGKPRVVRAWLDDRTILTWHVESLQKPKKVDGVEWNSYRMLINLDLSFDFAKLVDLYRKGKHGITQDDVFGLKLNDHMCAVRRAIRDVNNSDIIRDVPIGACIEWGLRRDSLPNDWKGLPKGWKR